MNNCEALAAIPAAGVLAALQADERESAELLMINPRLYNWKLKKGAPDQTPERLSIGFGFPDENCNGDHGHSHDVTGAGDGGNDPLAAAGPWRRFAKSNG